MAKANDNAEVTETTEVEETPRAPRAISTTAIPAHLRSTGNGGGGGRPRVATEFDELVVDWHANYDPEVYNKIPCESVEDVENTFKAVKRAADLHEFGISREKETDPNAEGGLAVYVQIKDKSKRGPKVGSRKDPETGKMVAPGDEGYDELVAKLDAAK